MPEIRLSKIPTLPPEDLAEEACLAKTKKLQKKIEKYRHILYAQQKYSLLVVIQGMDASGKDSATREVFSKVNPSGIHVKSFKKPTDEEMAHDFLWRVHRHVPEKGMIQVFNRSHYEDVLIQRVHKWIDEATVQKRFRHINDFEQLLEDHDTKVIKFYLHVSKEDQLKELDERLEVPEKYYKHNANDYKEREHWDAYMRCYEDVFSKCGPDIPWHIIPSDKKWYKEYLMSKVIHQTLKEMDLSYPTPEEGK